MGLMCPACGNNLSEISVGDIKVDVCSGGCGGIWFDNFELEKFDEKCEYAGDELLEVKRDINIKIDSSVKRNCPQCENVIMTKHFFSVKRAVAIDECSSCGGIWLDAGELRDIRESFPTEEARHKAFDEHFEDLFGEAVNQKHKKSEEDLIKARKAVHAFRFICPSYYVPVSRGWGVF